MRIDGLMAGTFIRRYKRFFVDARLQDGTLVTAHCANTGSLMGCLTEGAPVLLLPADTENRKLRYSLLFIDAGRGWVGVDTSLAPRLVEEDLARFDDWATADRVIREVPYGTENSRIDLLVSWGGTPSLRHRRQFDGDRRVYLEVKNTTFATTEADGRTARFPDAVTTRGQKHMRELARIARSRDGYGAAVVFVAQRADCQRFAPAFDIDPDYGRALRAAARAGVRIHAVAAPLSGQDLRIDRALPVDLSLPSRRPRVSPK